MITEIKYYDDYKSFLNDYENKLIIQRIKKGSRKSKINKIFNYDCIRNYP